MGVGDLIHEDNTGHGASVAWQAQRDRAAAMQASWAAGALGIESPMSEERQERSRQLRNLRAPVSSD